MIQSSLLVTLRTIVIDYVATLIQRAICTFSVLLEWLSDFEIVYIAKIFAVDCIVVENIAE